MNALTGHLKVHQQLLTSKFSEFLSPAFEFYFKGHYLKQIHKLLVRIPCYIYVFCSQTTTQNTGKLTQQLNNFVIKYISINYFNCEEFLRQGVYSLNTSVVTGLENSLS